mmetsp:Transcript_62403/g.122761  ORF Transcript_62403/g.122761 Transcript_62403/m.122761 type:complete len:139 (-) Transcript_62403:1836-2252(-)
MHFHLSAFFVLFILFIPLPSLPHSPTYSSQITFIKTQKSIQNPAYCDQCSAKKNTGSIYRSRFPLSSSSFIIHRSSIVFIELPIDPLINSLASVSISSSKERRRTRSQHTTTHLINNVLLNIMKKLCIYLSLSPIRNS